MSKPESVDAAARENERNREPTGSDSLKPDATAFVHQKRQLRHTKNKDLKVVITQRDSETGGGKSTLATWLALCWDPHGWDGDEKGTTKPKQFLETMPGLPPHSVMILDEAEALDARRSMADRNIEFSKKWMKMRTRQIDSILTLPTASALDKRILELADLRLHVTRRGRCKVYEVTVGDRDRKVDERFIEFYHWPDVSDSEAFENLDEEKQEDLDETAETEKDDEPDEEAIKKAIRQEAKRRRRDGETVREVISNIPNNPDTGKSYSTHSIQRWTEDVEVPD